MAELLKVDRNGSKHWRGEIVCDRCGGKGVYYTGVCNGQLVPAYPDDGVCWKCGGKGRVIDTWIERTPEYQAKLDAKREAKWAAAQAKLDAERAQREAERKAEEERKEAERLQREAELAAERARSQYVGTVGERMTVEVEYLGSPYYKRRDFYGNEETCYIHSFRDAAGNKLVWRTGKGLQLDEGQHITLTGTVKDHTEYKGEKQTMLLRCKVKGELK